MTTGTTFTEPRSCPICRHSTVGLFCVMEDRDRKGREWQVWECSSCRYGWTLPEISPQDLAQYYPGAYLGDTRKCLDEFAAGTLQRHRSWRRETEKVQLVERFGTGGRILDVGASNGSFLLALDGTRWERVGVEFIGEVVNLVRERHPDLDLKTGEIHSVDIEPHSLDMITFWHVFEHLYEPQRVLARVAELLKPGGKVILSVPNFASFQRRLFKTHWYAFDVPRHLHHFSPRALEMLLQVQGFETLGHVFFSRMNNFHQLKYSLINWSEAISGSRILYYLMKPGLVLFQWLEAFSKGYGTVTTVARLQGGDDPVS